MDKQGIKPSLRPALYDGELQHVLTTNGESGQRFSTMKAAMCALATAMALQGCATMERHPILTAVGVGFVAGSLAASTSHRANGPDIATPSVDCTRTSCK
jgi:hypothetical protein